MQNLIERDLGSSLLSVAIIIGWLGIFFVLARERKDLLKFLEE